MKSLKKIFKINVTDFMAFRHLISRHNKGFVSFITSISVIGVTLGVASLIITLSILDGFEKTIKENVVSFTSHMQLYAFESQLLSDSEVIRQKIIARFPEVKEITPYLSREGMIKSQYEIDGMLVKGVDPKNDISAAKTRLVEGVYDLEERDEGMQRIIIGKRLAEKLKVKINDRVLMYVLGGSSLSLSETRIMQFVISGFYETGWADLDGSMVYVNLRNAQRLCQVGKNISGYDILLYDTKNIDNIATEIYTYLGYPYYTRTMYQKYRNFFAWIDLQKKPVMIILALIMIVATVNIIGTLLMIILGKSREIGTLLALGMHRADVVRIFLKQGMLIGIIGTSLGNIIAYLLCWAELKYKLFPLPSGSYMMTHVPIELSLMNFLSVTVAALIMCFLASLIPSKLASKMNPIKLIRFAA